MFVNLLPHVRVKSTFLHFLPHIRVTRTFMRRLPHERASRTFVRYGSTFVRFDNGGQNSDFAFGLFWALFRDSLLAF